MEEFRIHARPAGIASYFEEVICALVEETPANFVFHRREMRHQEWVSA
jgi:hypothetical protein